MCRRSPIGLLLVGSCVVVPWVFTTALDDVFYLPKVIVLWLLLIAGSWLAVLERLRAGAAAADPFVAVPAVDWPLAAFVSLSLLATLFSSDVHRSLVGEALQHQGAFTLLLYAGFFVIARRVARDGRGTEFTLGAIAAGAVAVASYAIVQRVGFDPIWGAESAGGPVFASIGQPNALAAYFVIAVPISVAIGRCHRGAIRWLAWCGAGLMVVAISFTSSWGGWLGLAAATLVIVATWLRGRHWGWQGVAAATIVLATIVALGFLTGDQAIDRGVSIADTIGGQSTSDHVDVWRVASVVIADNPLLGTGPDTFAEQFPRYDSEVLSADRVAYFDDFRVESPHNVYLAVAAGAGIPALLAYLLFVGGVIALVIRSTPSGMGTPTEILRRGILAALVGHIVTDLFMTAEVTGTWLFWVLLGLGVESSRSGRSAGLAPSNPKPPWEP